MVQLASVVPARIPFSSAMHSLPVAKLFSSSNWKRFLIIRYPANAIFFSPTPLPLLSPASARLYRAPLTPPSPRAHRCNFLFPLALVVIKNYPRVEARTSHLWETLWFPRGNHRIFLARSFDSSLYIFRCLKAISALRAILEYSVS